MKESFWGVLIISVGVVCIFFIYFFQSLTNTNEHNNAILKETTEAAMIDSLDLAKYRQSGVIRIDREKFVENFLRRFASSASLSTTYVVSIYDVNEEPPKVSLKVSGKAGGINPDGSELLNFDITNRLDAILETPY